MYVHDQPSFSLNIFIQDISQKKQLILSVFMYFCLFNSCLIMSLYWRKFYLISISNMKNIISGGTVLGLKGSTKEEKVAKTAQEVA